MKKSKRLNDEALAYDHLTEQMELVEQALKSATQGLRNYNFVFDALEESVKLQSHYAELLNMHDGGKRIKFANANEWLRKLKEKKDEM